jgi:hypothetical protein
VTREVNPDWCNHEDQGSVEEDEDVVDEFVSPERIASWCGVCVEGVEAILFFIMVPGMFWYRCVLWVCGLFSETWLFYESNV